MKITFLGTGTSHGVPRIACNCPVCSSNDSKNKRLRSSVMIENEKGDSLLIDPSFDFRQQALKYNILEVEYVLVTHIHADHIFGLDELRIYNRLMKQPIQLYLSKKFDKRIKKIFTYIYNKPEQKGGGITSVKNNVIKPYSEFTIKNFKIIPLKVKHGKISIFGYRINNIAYITDTSLIIEESFKYLESLDVLVINALRHRKHTTHFNLQDAIENSIRIGAKKTYFTHISHEIEHAGTSANLPENIFLAYDGLVLDLNE